MVWTGPIGRFMQDWTTGEIDVEGALSSGKTTACLHKELIALYKWPGIHSWIGRYGDGETQTKIKPAFEEILREQGYPVDWDAKSLAYVFAVKGKDSRCFSYGLKSPDALSRYSKIRGLGVARMYLDQTEELPEDFSLEVRLRLRQQGYPHQLTFSPNPQNVTHWLAKQFPTDNTVENRRLYTVSIHDNAHNLPPGMLEKALQAFPPEHAKYRSVILGQRGLNVVGEPCYRGAFVRALHERPCAYHPQSVLEEAIDFGKHHPCVVWRQQTPLGQTLYLGGILGEGLYLEDFLPLVMQYRAQWFPDPVEIRTCCDPAGASDNSQGVRDNGVKVLTDHGFLARWIPNSNAPDVRLAMLERTAGLMRRRTPQGEAFGVDDTRWLRISADHVVTDRFLADGYEAGYVWDEHLVSVGSKQVRRPKKDGWFEHGQNCFHPETRVITPDGLVPIATLPASGTVLSPSGWVPYHSARLTSREAPLVAVEFEDGSVVKATPDHFFLTDQGWVEAQDMLGRLGLAAEPARIRCSAVRPAGVSDVYCLTVPDDECFAVESGQIVHNCAEYLELNFGHKPPVAPKKPKQVARLPQVHGTGMDFAV